MEFPTGLVWFRRDLRLDDNAMLDTALRCCRQVHCVFVFDRAILDTLPRQDRRVEFIRESLCELDVALRTRAGKEKAGLIVRNGFATEEIPALAAMLGVQAVFAANDYEPTALARDTSVRQALEALQVQWVGQKDHVIFEKGEVRTQSGTPYTVFTPYLRAWLARLQTDPPKVHKIDQHLPSLGERPDSLRGALPSLESFGFGETNLRKLKIAPGFSGAQGALANFATRIAAYDQTRDFPAIKGPSYLGVHLRFGTVSIRQMVNLALEHQRQGSSGATTWLAELAWRDFYFQILFNFPHVVERSFKPAYDGIHWEQGALAEAHYSAWCQGMTGYPLVDAAMAQLNQSGYMHNRLRMVVASFLVKHLGINWRWGERYFAEKLNDFDLAANNGGWQWVSSSGCDAQPYFRIFNPVAQSQKFDPSGNFIKRYLPQLALLPTKHVHAPWTLAPAVLKQYGITLDENYPAPLVEHASARARTLARYATVRPPIQASANLEQ